MLYPKANILPLFLAGIFFFCLPSFVYAGGGWEGCVIENGPSEELSNYIANTDMVIERVLDNATNKCVWDSVGASADKLGSALVGSLNSTIGFSNFVTATRFYVEIALKTEIPSAINQDHAKLGQELQKIRSAMEIVYAHCAENSVAENNFLETDPYETKGKTNGTIIQELLINQVEMMNFYRATVLGDEAPYSSFKLVGNSEQFETDMIDHYGPQGFAECIQKNDVFKGIKEALTRISTGGGSIETGMQEWKNASLLLNNANNDQNNAEKRRNVFRIKLGAQGISMDFSQTTVNNMIKYGSPDPIVWISGKIKSIGDIFTQTVNGGRNSYNSRYVDLRNARVTDQYANIRKNITVLSDINADIEKDYVETKELIWTENLSADDTVTKLIGTHIKLEDTQTFIRSYIKIAEQVCNSQGKGDGNCSFK